jgi:flagellar hook protein FlgE
MMNVNANNVANVNTDGFIPSDVRMANTGNSVSANIRKADDNGSLKSQTNLTKEIPDQIVASNVTSLNVTTIKTQDEMLGSLLDMKG